MSLINEALKKAQKQRTQEPLIPAPAGGPPPPRVAKRKQPMPAQTLVVIGGLCLVLLAALGFGAWLVLKQSSTQIQAVAQSKAPPEDKTSASTETPAVGGTVGPAPGTVAAVPPASTNGTDPAATAIVPAPVPQTPNVAATTTATPVSSVPSTGTLSTTPAIAAVGPAPLAAGPAAAPTPEPVEIIQITAAHLTPRIVSPNPQTLAVVDTFKVSGIRATSTDPKVLMNDRVFRLNDIVERTHGLRLTEIHTDRLTFIDEAGAIYSKSF